MIPRLKHPNGYVIVIAVLGLLVFSVLSISLLKSYLVDTKQQLFSAQYDESYFLAQGAYERAQFEWTYGSTPHFFDGSASNDTTSLSVNLDGISVTVKAKDAYQY